MKKRLFVVFGIALIVLLIMGCEGLFGEKKVPATGLTISGSDSVASGSTATYSAALVPADTTDSLGTVSWSIQSDEDGTGSTIDSASGVFTAAGMVNEATVVIKATSGSLTATKTVTITYTAPGESVVNLVPYEAEGIENYAVIIATKASLQNYLNTTDLPELVLTIFNENTEKSRTGWGIGFLESSSDENNLYGSRSETTVQAIEGPDGLEALASVVAVYPLEPIVENMEFDYLTSNLYNDCVITKVDIRYFERPAQ